MKIETQKHPPYLGRTGWVTQWSAWDMDTYDGAPDSHCPVGTGSTELEAVIDLATQTVEKLETQLNRWICREWALRKELTDLRHPEFKGLGNPAESP
jgi:hypothetical protein